MAALQERPRPAMADKIYLRPLGLTPAVPRDRSRKFAGALPLCGDGPYDFTAVEIIERRGSTLFRESVTLAELWASDRRALDPEHADILERIGSRRPPLAGLPLDRSRIMGVINVTPDSFSDGGRLAGAEAAIEHGLALLKAGADILDIGGESTRPGSEPTPLATELDRVIPVIEGLKARANVVISIDTRKAAVMRQAIAAGADIVNEVSALTHDPESIAAVAAARVPVVLMHSLGDPKTMQENPHYDDVLTDVYDGLQRRIEACEAGGIARSRIVVDPGLGFGKSFAHNLQLLAGLTVFHGLGVPLLLGASRKRFIGILTGEPVAAARVSGSVAAALFGLARGVQILRVHDVAATRTAVQVFEAAESGQAPLAAIVP